MDRYLRREKLRIRVLDTPQEKEHFHGDVEVLYILEGTLDVMIGDQITHLGAEDILVVNANKKHRLHGSERVLFVELSIAYELLSDVFQSVDIIFWCDSTKGENAGYDELRHAIKLLLNHYLSTRGGTGNFGHIALCYRVMDILSIHFLVRTADKECMTEQDRFDDRIRQIDNYIRTNYNQPISMKDLSEKLFLSNGYLSRFFKRNYGMSFIEYLTNVRLYHAMDELLYTSIPMTRIAYDNGFASVAVFNKAVKKSYHDTPTAIRRRAKTQKEPSFDEEQPEAVERLAEYLRNDSAEEVPTAPAGVLAVEHSATGGRRLRPVWKSIINGGSAEDLLRSDVQADLLQLHSRLGFHYVRFWNIFSEQLLIDIDRNDGSYNFSRLDIILDFLTQHGMRPFIELGQKPKFILENVQSMLLQADHFKIFRDIGQWDRLLEALMRHLIRRYGSEQLDQWKMEIWYDDRYPESQTKIRDYYELFDHTCGIVKQYAAGMELGGCGINADYNFAFGMDRDFLLRWGKARYRPDFISMMFYGYERGMENGEVYSRRSTNNDGLKHHVEQLRATMKETGFEDCRLYLTEWNLTVSDRNAINDTCFKGAYIVKNIMDVYDKVDAMGYYLGSDRVSEYYDTNRLLQGGRGLITRQGIMKPAGFAFDFLNRLYPYLIGRGENYMITASNHQSYGILCHNQKKLNYNYYFVQENQVEQQNTWKYYEDREGLELELRLTELDTGGYYVKTYRISEENGSVLRTWGDMGYIEELSANDIRYFQRVCEPKLSIQQVQVEDGTMQLDVQLAPNEIAFIRIRRMT